jgi:hypothetical protein
MWGRAGEEVEASRALTSEEEVEEEVPLGVDLCAGVWCCGDISRAAIGFCAVMLTGSGRVRLQCC